MAQVAINAMSLRKGGGLQVMAGLLSRFTPSNTYTVLWTDPQSREILQSIVGERSHIRYVNPVGNTANAVIFAWGMVRQQRWLKASAIDCVFGVNHHFPSGDVPQVTYHLNVLRFDRPRHGIFQSGEVADRLRDWRAREALRLSNANLFESKILFKIAQESASEIRNPRVVYIGLDDRRSVPPPSELSGENRCAILAVTSAAEHKDNATLIRMLASLCAKAPEMPWKLNIAGGLDGSSLSTLKDLSDDLGVSNRISYLGFLSHDALIKFGSQSLCLVSTSLVESFCMVALEAMSWRCPVVVADSSSMPESVGSAGLLARPSDPDDFAEKVMLLLNPEFRTNLVEAGLTRAGAMTWTSAASQVEDEIAKAVAGRSR